MTDLNILRQGAETYFSESPKDIVDTIQTYGRPITMANFSDYTLKKFSRTMNLEKSNCRLFIKNEKLYLLILGITTKFLELHLDTLDIIGTIEYNFDSFATLYVIDDNSPNFNLRTNFLGW